MAFLFARFLLFFAFFAVSALAIQPKVSVSATSFDLVSGRKVSVQYALDSPITCPPTAEHCDVVIKLTNSHPDIISIDNCMVKWNYNEFSAIRIINIEVKSSFVSNQQITAKITAEPADSASIYYSGEHLSTATYYQISLFFFFYVFFHVLIFMNICSHCYYY